MYIMRTAVMVLIIQPLDAVAGLNKFYLIYYISDCERSCIA